ncbi:MAG: ABC transporter permease [Deltaproteobacteria bacterium]|nr:ABC transporter permease [Deltaproteobacteria bacterium]
MPTPRQMAISRLPNDELLIQLSGCWTLAEGVPSTENVRSECDGASPPQRVSFDTQAIAGWDSALPTYLRGLLDLLASHGIDTDRSGLPEGVQRLLDLAAAVPEAEIEVAFTGGSLPTRLGRAAIRRSQSVTESIRFLGEIWIAVMRLATGRAHFRVSDFALTLQQCGAEAVGIVTLVSFLVGLILAFIGAIQLQQFGAQIFVADLVALGMAREMGAMMTAIIMAGRTGASFAAQLGTMTANEEIDALETMGISPTEFLVLPRLLALTLMLPLLCLYSNLLGIVGGAVVGVGMLDLGVVSYFEQTRNALSLADFGAGLVKAVVYGSLVAVSGCLRGMQCGRSAAAVGKATTSAVVTAIVLIVIASGIINVIDHILG